MPDALNKKVDLDAILDRIREGIVEGIGEEIERRRRLHIPFYVSINGRVQLVMADGTPVAGAHMTDPGAK